MLAVKEIAKTITALTHRTRTDWQRTWQDKNSNGAHIKTANQAAAPAAF